MAIPVQSNKRPKVTGQKSHAMKFHRKSAYDALHATRSGNHSPQQNSKLLTQAKQHIEQALELGIEDGDSLNLLARIELERGQLKAAELAIFQAINEAPQNGGYWYSAGHVALAQQNFAKAKTAFRNAISFSPKETRAEVSLAYTLAQDGKLVEAFQHYRELAKTQSQDLHIRSQVVDLASRIQADKYDIELEQDLLSFLKWDKVNLNQLGTLVCSLLEYKFELNQHGSATDFDGIASCPLLLAALRHTLIKSETLEKLIMALRHELLSHSTQQGQLGKDYIGLCQGIAQYGLRNEYILPCTEAEDDMVNVIKNVINQSLNQFGCTTLDISGALLLLSMYQSWQDLEQYEKLMSFDTQNWPEETYQLKLYHDEFQKLKSYEFEKLTPIASSKEHNVKCQYERYPYPKWQTLDYKKNINYGTALRHEYPNAKIPRYVFDDNLNILIAGCGTGRHALNVAKYFNGVKVLAVDISQNSLAYAQHMSMMLDIGNIDFKLADLTKLPELGKKFSIIECSGVLHHIRHYKKALHNLLSNLKPNGLIKISLYSQRTRKPVVQVREIFKKEDIQFDRHKIQVTRHAIMQSDLIDRKIGITQSDDFYSMSGTVDMLFHEYEKHYTPLMIKQMCHEFQLTWLGFSNLSPQIKVNFNAFHGSQADFLDLKQWDEFEEKYPNTFANMFQFYCQYQPKLRLRK
ncbi:MAG: methyltransferase domain-containing protein [Cycloclasticus sp.]